MQYLDKLFYEADHGICSNKNTVGDPTTKSVNWKTSQVVLSVSEYNKLLLRISCLERKVKLLDKRTKRRPPYR